MIVPDLFQDPRNLLMAGTAFVLVLSIWVLVILAWSMRRGSRRRQIQQRLESRSETREQQRVLRLWRGEEEAVTHAPRATDRLSWAERLGRLPEQAGWHAPLRSVLLGGGGLVTLVGAVTLLLTHNPLAAVGTAAVTVSLLWVYLRHRISAQAARFEAQLVDALRLVARSLRAGHPVLGAFQLVADELEAPVSDAFRDICQQQSLGVNLDIAIRRSAESSASHDFRFFAAAVATALQSGGNLADMMDRMAFVIRERIRLGQRVRVLTSQAQLSKRILLVIPLVLGVLIYLINPVYMSDLIDSRVGNILLAAAGASMALGAWVMNRMATIRY